MKTIAVHTLGCKVNQYDTEAMLESFERAGYTAVSMREKADVYLINTCTVTGTGDTKSEKLIRRCARQNPEGAIIVAGCLAQRNPEHLLQMDNVRLVIGIQRRAQVVQLLEQAVAEGAEVVFTTTPQLSRITLKVALKYPKVRFLNCSVDQPYSSTRTYYGRIYEGKFITGAIAGAMANDDRIGYIGSSPIFGVPASINAFALGALMTNPRATVELRWSCMEGDHMKELLDSGIRVISNREVPTAEQKYLNLCSYGTYLFGEDGSVESLGSPYWDWGKLYEHVIKSILDGTWDKAKGKAVNYWWGMDSGVIDVKFPQYLPPGVKELAEMLRTGLQQGTLDPFHRTITAQDGTLKNDGSRGFTAEELLHMDWLCDNVNGHIPSFHEVAPYARSIVQALGIHRDQLPVRKEGNL
jgi:basic membrane lipoprotein Med (substrate-binding protein (PBP1-ABC) superfamily)